MTDDRIWSPLRHELDRWQAAKRVARLWLRDDDATEPTEALDRLLALTGRASVPVTLAVIPAPTGAALAERLADESRVLVAPHGWSHTNHAGPDEKKQELGNHRPADAVLGELGEGLDKLRRRYEDKFVSMLVPPWNRISRALIPQLPALGFESLSVYGRAKPGGPMPLLNTHVDIMNWHGTRGGLPHVDLVAALVAELRDRFDGNAEPIGILTHHLVHDGIAWDFLERLASETAGHPAVQWKTSRELLAA